MKSKVSIESNTHTHTRRSAGRRVGRESAQHGVSGERENEWKYFVFVFSLQCGSAMRGPQQRSGSVARLGSRLSAGLSNFLH